jgi:hypothetical protein
MSGISPGWKAIQRLRGPRRTPPLKRPKMTYARFIQHPHSVQFAEIGQPRFKGSGGALCRTRATPTLRGRSRKVAK